MDKLRTFPPQQLPINRKNKEWRKKHLDWADDHTSFNSSNIRSSIMNKRINYDLVNGKIHMDDLMLILNPTGLNSAFIPDTIQHYSVLNSKLRVLGGEEIGRRFEYKVICTNPNAISEIEKNKQEALFQNVQRLIESQVESEDEMKGKLQELEKEFKYNWQDLREIRANALLNHYSKEYNIDGLFSSGFMDAMICGEEIYHCYVSGGEPMIEKINPCKLKVFRSGYSSKIEDADVLVYEDYWTLGKILDVFHEDLEPKDVKYLEELPHSNEQDEAWNRDETLGFVRADEIFSKPDGFVIDNYLYFTDGAESEICDADGNIRVLQVFWKSRRQIKKVKSYNDGTGEPEYNFYTEDYIIDADAGEEEEIYWINEAWEGYKIGKEVYTRIRPCEVQYNSMSNPSRCHFGFIGSFYNINEDRVFSLVDILKPFAYLYDVIHARLNEAIEANFGQLFELDMASVPSEWTPEKWLYYAKTNHLAIKDSFKEGNVGAATGKLAGNFAANSRGLIGTNTGDYINQHVQLLQYIKEEMADACGITRQREGNISNRETVGGVERSTLQSSYITEWLFSTHTDVKRRVMECFLENAKIAMKGKSKKFQYILPDMSLAMIDVDGDEFAENDYGLVVDSSPYAQNLTSKLEALSQAALQSQLISFSSLMRIYTSNSLSETIRMIEEEETAAKEQQQQQMQQQMQMQEQQMQQQMQMEQAKLQLEQSKLELQNEMNTRDNQTRLQVAQIQAQSRIEAEQIYGDSLIDEEIEMAKIQENARQFDAKQKQDAVLQQAQMKHEKDLQNAQNKIARDKQTNEARKRKSDEEFKEKELELKAEELQIKRKQANKKTSTK